jgi:hypothetical protein
MGDRSNEVSRRRSAAKWLRRTALAGLVTFGGLAVGQGSAIAANSGSITCFNSGDVVGVWVNVSGGSSGWASRTGSGIQQNWSYNTQGRSYSLTVGCGGSPSRWASQASTPYYSTSWSNLSCFPGWQYGVGSIYAHDRCYAG